MKLLIDLIYFEVNENLYLNIIEISDPIIIHDPSINPMKPQGLKVVKYDCIVINILSVKKLITKSFERLLDKGKNQILTIEKQV